MQPFLQSLALLLPAIIILLPIIAALVSYAIQRVENSPDKNAGIAASTIILTAAITAFLQGRLTGNATTDTLYVLTLATALQSNTFAPIDAYLREHFPTSSTPPAQQPQPPPSANPQPIVLPNNKPPVAGQ